MIADLLKVFGSTVIDVLPIAALIGLFQVFVIRKEIPNLKRVLLGVLAVIIGLALFLIGLEKALFPIGNLMAIQLSTPEFLGIEAHEVQDWRSYYWLLIFASAIGFSTTIAEPSLMAVAMKANEVSGGTISQTGLRLVVALGVALALIVGNYRIITGTALHLYILAAYVVVIVQTIFAPKYIVALAYDSGGVTTSTVTVPIVAAMGLGLASSIPGRNPAIDGFGLIAFACLFPIITVLAYGQMVDLLIRFNKNRKR